MMQHLKPVGERKRVKMNHNRLKNKRNNNAKRKNGNVFNYLCEKSLMQKKRNTSRPAPRFGANKKKNTTGRKKFDGPRFARNDGSLAEDYQRDMNGNTASRGSSKKRISTGDKPFSKKTREHQSFDPKKRTGSVKPFRKTEGDPEGFSGRKRATRETGSSFSETKRTSRYEKRGASGSKSTGYNVSRETTNNENREHKPRSTRESFSGRNRNEKADRSSSGRKPTGYKTTRETTDNENREYKPRNTRESFSGRNRNERTDRSEVRGNEKGTRKTFEKRPSTRKPIRDRFSRETEEQNPKRRFSDEREESYVPRERNERPQRKNSRSDYSVAKKPFEKRSGKKNGKKEEPSSKEGIRLNKYIANAGICSRREADEYIRSGVVTVNGKAITEMGYQVQDGDVVKFGDRAIRPEKPVYILLNKPKDYITTTDDPDGRHIVTELVKVKERVFPVGRLDRNTTGVLLLTNDGDLAERLMHPKYEVPKVYLALLDKRFEKRHMEQLLEGVELEDGPITPDELAYVEGDKKKIGVVIHSGRNRIVHRMFNHLGYNVEKLDRTSYAGLTKRDLKRSEWRTLTPEEVMSLKRLVKLKGKY